MFAEDRFVGVVHAVDGEGVSVTLPMAAAGSSNLHGRRLRRGEVGQFLLIQVGPEAVLGRLISVAVLAADLRKLGDPQAEPMAQGRVQLLGTLDRNGSSDRGIARYPTVGDRVFDASEDAVKKAIAVQGGKNTAHLGKLSVGEIDTRVNVDDLFGRHLAVVGATGSGKSWTVAHLAETTVSLGGKMIVLDPTGEFRSLDEGVTHLSVGTGKVDQDVLQVGVPHHLMRETDRIALFLPSSGTQLPKMHAAVRSLRLAHHAEVHSPELDCLEDGSIVKPPGGSSAEFDAAFTLHSEAVEDPYGPFDLTRLSVQIRHECVKPGTGSRFGPVDTSAVTNVGSLITRIDDVLQSTEVMNVIGSTIQEDVLSELEKWFADASSNVLCISLKYVAASHNLREIVVNILGHHLLRRAREGLFADIPLVVSIDEAHQFLGRTIGDDSTSSRLDAFELIAKEGRKYGLTLCIATQRPSDLPAGMLSQVGMMIIHRIADGQDRQMVAAAAAEMDVSSLQLLPGLRQGEAVVMGVDLPVPVAVRMQRPDCPPRSDGPNYSSGWGIGR